MFVPFAPNKHFLRISQVDILKHISYRVDLYQVWQQLLLHTPVQDLADGASANPPLIG